MPIDRRRLMTAAKLVGSLWPDLPVVVHKIIAPPPVADLWMVLYLVTKGVRVPRLNQLARLSRRSERTV